MKRYLICTILLLSACHETGASNAAKQTEMMPDVSSIALPENLEASKMTRDFLSIMDKKMSIAAEIGRIEIRDQYSREVFIDMFSDPNLDLDVRAAFQKAGGEYVTALDRLNTASFKKIMENITWRDLAQGESRLASRAFQIVQHSSDLDFQLDTLAQIKPLAEEGLMEGQSYALLYDRVTLKREGGQQLYGSQTKCINGQYDVFDLAEPDTVDARRKQMGLEPLEVYLNRNREYYGPC